MSQSGICSIKQEFLIPDCNSHLTSTCENESLKCNQVGREATDENDSSDERSNKKIKYCDNKKKKSRGQNKARPVPFKRDVTVEICQKLSNVAVSEEFEECTNENCKFLHDVQEYLKNKPADIGSTCYIFETFGRCPRGIACRFGSAHITADGKNLINNEIYEKFKSVGPQTLNTLSHDVQWALRKRTYQFSRSENIIKEYDIGNEQKNSKCDLEKTSGENNNENCIEKNSSNNSAFIGCITDEDVVKVRQLEKKCIDWKDKLFLSPLTTVGNLPFRRICKEFGADITCGEMAMCVALLQGANQEWALVKRHKSEDIFGVQVCGNNPHIIGKTAEVLQEQMEIDFIDLNLGCPIDLVYKQGAGSGLLRRERILESIIKCTSKLLDIPLTIKTRTGVYANQNIAHKLVPKFREWGASMVTIHGRSREQRYTRSANWEYINECAGLAKPMPVFGNGDILSYNDYQFVMDNYKNVSGVAIGRGALIKPWIFTEIKEHKLWDISSNERLDILKKYANYGLEHWGSDTKGVENTRRFMLEWLSFLYRYVPVGILENPPQKINERPPYFRGRDDLETLMASPNCTDWIKLSEMILGPVPDNFTFLPKHKANSY